CISDTLVPTTYLVDTTLSNSSDSDQTVQAVRLRLIYQLVFILNRQIILMTNISAQQVTVGYSIIQEAAAMPTFVRIKSATN
ncbi:hypothetical protein ACRW4C_25220, partial [Escherichia coli]